MSDWNFLNLHRCKEPSRYVAPQYCTTEEDGCNGMFRFTVCGKSLRCIASDGMGWKHVSVSVEFDGKPPTWDIMCAVKDLFFDDEDWVTQFHPAKSEYVNYHSGCLHLWKYTGGGPFQMPIPASILVGPKRA